MGVIKFIGFDVPFLILYDFLHRHITAQMTNHKCGSNAFLRIVTFSKRYESDAPRHAHEIIIIGWNSLEVLLPIVRSQNIRKEFYSLVQEAFTGALEDIERHSF